MQTQNYVSETSRSDQEKLCRERIATGVSIKQLVSNNHVAGSIAQRNKTREEHTPDNVVNYSTSRSFPSAPGRIGKASFFVDRSDRPI